MPRPLLCFAQVVPLKCMMVPLRPTAKTSLELAPQTPQRSVVVLLMSFSHWRLRTQRKPAQVRRLLSGSLLRLAARMCLEMFWNEPPRMTRSVPLAGPAGLTTLAEPRSPLNQSWHHSLTLPAMS